MILKFKRAQNKKNKIQNMWYGDESIFWISLSSNFDCNAT